MSLSHWRSYRWDPELWAYYQDQCIEKRFEYWSPGPLVQRAVLARPLFRVLAIWPSHGMSPFSLAAITKHSPTEVWKQIQKEGINYLSFCSTTRLPTFDAYRLLKVEARYTAYAGQAASVDRSMMERPGLLGGTFEGSLKAYPKEKWKIDFCLPGREKETFPISKELKTRLSKAYYLGVPYSEVKTRLLLEDEQE
jgi:hypothetical protein